MDSIVENIENFYLAFVYPILECIVQGFANDKIADFFGYTEEEISLLSQELLGFPGWTTPPEEVCNIYTQYKNSTLTNLEKYGIICNRFGEIERRLGYVD